MSKLFVFVIVLATLFASCDGRYRSYQSNQNNLKQHNLYKSFSENVVYLPENYSEITSDTLLSNGFYVKIKTFTDMDNSFLNVLKKDAITYKNHYRNLMAIINIYKDNKNIVTTWVTKDSLLNYDVSYNMFLKDKILQGVWLNQYDSTVSNAAVMDIAFCNPSKKETVCFKLVVSTNGNYFIEKKPKSKTV